MADDDSEDDSELSNEAEVLREALQPVMMRMTAKMEESINGTLSSSKVEEAQIGQKKVEEALHPLSVSVSQSGIRIQQALQPAMYYALKNLETSLSSALVNLGSPSIYADISSVSTTEESSESQTAKEEFTPPTDVDEIRPPETRIHDKLVWEDGEWYREKATETAVTVVDYSFWKAKEAGELTDASDEEVSIGAFAAAFCMAMALSANPIGWASAAFVISEGFQKGAQERSERKDLNEKFGEE